MHLRVLAFDLDGTLTDDDRVAIETWKWLRRAKAAGFALFLVTGHTLDTLVTTYALFTELCDAIVAENGAVIHFPRRDEFDLPFGRLPPALIAGLKTIDVPLERGEAIAATYAPDDEAVLDVVRATGAGTTIAYNRGAFMLLPSGATKGSGLRYALHELGYSPRNLVACGDAENDRSLLRVAELAVTPANATAELQAVADIVLPQPDGAGIRGLLDDLLAGRVPARALRPGQRVLLGQQVDDDQATPIYLDPFSLVDGTLGIVGASGSGKSWLAGLLAEELLAQGYQLCIVDPEGDYRSLRAFPHTMLLGGPDTRLPRITDLVTLIEHTDLSLILDLSVYSVAERTRYVLGLMPTLLDFRTRRGRPHWVLIDEVQSFCPPWGGALTDMFLAYLHQGGIGIVTYRPSQVAQPLLDGVAQWLLTRLNLQEELAVVHRCLDGDEVIPAHLPTLPIDQAYLCRVENGKSEVIKLRSKPRAAPHVRHVHKYLRALLPDEKRFYFHDASGRYLGYVAANLQEFRDVLEIVPLSSLRYHLKRDDFSRWLTDVLRDAELARRIRKINHRDIQNAALREALVVTVRDRYEELSTLL